MQIHINKSGDLAGNTTYLLKEKLEKLTTFYERIEKATVHIKQDEGAGENEATINVRLSVPGPDIVAEATEDSMEKSIAEVHDKLRRQLKKLKEKQSDRN